LGWRVIVELPESEVTKGLWAGFLTNIGIGALIILVTIGAVGYTITVYQRRLEREATTDKLTGVANRSAFDLALELATRRYERSGVPMSLVIIDIDHFKHINDEFGHLAGDEAIRAVAAMIRDRTRATDLICRWGGDEFIVLMEAAAGADAARAAEDIRRASAEIELKGASHRVTISAGVAQARSGDDSDALLTRADRALYIAKDNGRDRVHLVVD